MLIGRACGRYVFEVREMDVCVIASKCDCLQPRPSLHSVVLGCGWYTIELSITVGDVLAVYRSCDVRVWLWRCGVVSKRVGGRDHQ